MNAPSSSLYAVLLARPDPIDFHVLAQAIAKAEKALLADVVPRARRLWGILKENLPEPDARAYVEKLKSAGLDAISVPAGAVAVLPAPRISRKAMLIEGQARFLLVPSGEIDLCPERVTLIAAAGIDHAVESTITRHEGPSAMQKVANVGILLSTGLPIKLGPKERDVKIKVQGSERLHHLEIFLKNPFQRIQIDAQTFDYSCLGPKKALFLWGNFKALLEELKSRFPNAALNEGVQLITAGRPAQDMHYDGPDSLERECRWRLTLGRL